MRKRSFNTQKTPGQAMAEFAIALPVLLLLLYGIIEAGRMLFIYSTVVTASRQAARYGTTTGDGGGTSPLYGAPRAVVPRYRDCAGIRGAATKVGYLSQDGFNIDLAYDRGPTTTETPFCTAGTATEVSSSPSTDELEGNSTRLVVTVTEDFKPLLPKLFPFFERDIVAKSARTILYSVPVVVEATPQIYPQPPTRTTIVRDEPDPSEPTQTVTVQVLVVDTVDASNTPSGTVEVTGGDAPCTINYPAQNSCTITFAAVGVYDLYAVYTPDDEHLPSASPAEDHTVDKAQTVTTIIEDNPDPSLEAETVRVSVTVTGGMFTPTGTVTIDAGNKLSCTITLAGGAGSCTLPAFGRAGDYTINAQYNGDATHKVSSDSTQHEVLQATPTPKPTRTPTLVPTITMTPTITLTPTKIPTPVPSCSSITHGSIKKSGNTLTMTITNPYQFTLVMKDVTVTWNDDKGHKSGADKSLKLQGVSVGSDVVWTGNVGNQSTYTVPTTATIPPGTTTITFTFNQSYDNFDGTENILINWLTPGCEGNPVNAK